MPTYTCSACADAVVHAGGEPIAVDCELDTFGLSFDAVKACLDHDAKVAENEGRTLTFAEACERGGVDKEKLYVFSNSELERILF